MDAATTKCPAKSSVHFRTTFHQKIPCVVGVPRPLSASFARFNEPSPGQPGVTHSLFPAAAATTLPPPRRRLLGNRYSIALVQNFPRRRFFPPFFFSLNSFPYLWAMKSQEQRLRVMSTNSDMTDKLSRAVLWPTANLARAVESSQQTSLSHHASAAFRDPSNSQETSNSYQASAAFKYQLTKRRKKEGKRTSQH